MTYTFLPLPPMIVPDQPLLLLPSLLNDEIWKISFPKYSPYKTPPPPTLLLFTCLTSYSDNGNNTDKEVVGLREPLVVVIDGEGVWSVAVGVLLGIRMVCILVGVIVGKWDGAKDGTLVCIGEALSGFAVFRWDGEFVGLLVGAIVGEGIVGGCGLPTEGKLVGCSEENIDGQYDEGSWLGPDDGKEEG